MSTLPPPPEVPILSHNNNINKRKVVNTHTNSHKSTRCDYDKENTLVVKVNYKVTNDRMCLCRKKRSMGQNEGLDSNTSPTKRPRRKFRLRPYNKVGPAPNVGANHQNEENGNRRPLGALNQSSRLLSNRRLPSVPLPFLPTNPRINVATIPDPPSPIPSCHDSESESEEDGAPALPEGFDIPCLTPVKSYKDGGYLHVSPVGKPTFDSDHEHEESDGLIVESYYTDSAEVRKLKTLMKGSKKSGMVLSSRPPLPTRKYRQDTGMEKNVLELVHQVRAMRRRVSVFL
eukprot:m.343777 g.343777  ORF g.343777 m.343777 type:complete len:287 (+) comp23286_c0_seq1:348-1208(+)